MADTPPLYARSSSSNPLGKCSAELKTLVPDEIRDEFAAVAKLNGQTVSELLRDIVIKEMRGSIFVLQQIVQRGRQNGMAGIGQE